MFHYGEKVIEYSYQVNHGYILWICIMMVLLMTDFYIMMKEVFVIEGLMILGVILLIMGFVFVGIEMVIPGFGAHGILGTCCLIAGVVLLSDTVKEAIIIITIILIVLAIMFVVIMTLLSKGKLNSPIILHEKQEKENGYISSNDLNYLLGKRGIASTDLRPSGRGVFDEIEFDVISDGRYISIGGKIEIYKVSNSKLVVREFL